jgi:hypothetical protein
MGHGSMRGIANATKIAAVVLTASVCVEEGKGTPRGCLYFVDSMEPPIGVEPTTFRLRIIYASYHAITNVISLTTISH